RQPRIDPGLLVEVVCLLEPLGRRHGRLDHASGQRLAAAQPDRLEGLLADVDAILLLQRLPEGIDRVLLALRQGLMDPAALELGGRAFAGLPLVDKLVGFVAGEGEVAAGRPPRCGGEILDGEVGHGLMILNEGGIGSSAAGAAGSLPPSESCPAQEAAAATSASSAAVSPPLSTSLAVSPRGDTSAPA